jgi:hypothetical protein
VIRGPERFWNLGGLQLLLGTLEQISGFSNVPSLAHLGGATVGLLYWLKRRNSMPVRTQTGV